MPPYFLQFYSGSVLHWKKFTQVLSYVVCTKVRRHVHKQITKKEDTGGKVRMFCFRKSVLFTLGLGLATPYSLGILVWNFYQTFVTVSVNFWQRFEPHIWYEINSKIEILWHSMESTWVGDSLGTFNRIGSRLYVLRTHQILHQTPNSYGRSIYCQLNWLNCVKRQMHRLKLVRKQMNRTEYEKKLLNWIKTETNENSRTKVQGKEEEPNKRN